MKLRAFLTITSGLLCLGAPAFAGERTNLGDIPTLPAPKDATDAPKTMGVPGLTLKEVHTSRSSYYEVHAASAQGYCLVNRDHVFELQTDTTDTASDEVWRLVEKDGTATLERTRYEIAPFVGNVWVKSKVTIELKALATDLGLTAWGMREANGDVVVLAKRVTFGQESGPQSETGFSSTTSGCIFGAARIRAAALKTGGGTAQLTGRLPAEGEGKSRVEPQFVIDVSAVKVSRQPEPVVSVRLRRNREG